LPSVVSRNPLHDPAAGCSKARGRDVWVRGTSLGRLQMRARTAWVLLAAVLIGWLVVPRAVSAATSLVRIQDGAGSTTANVTDGHQLQVAESAPTTFREYNGAASSPGCHPLVTVPSNKGLLLRSVSFTVLTSSTDGFHIVSLFPNGTCTGGGIFSAPTNKVDVYSLDLTPGFALAAGDKLSFEVSSSAVAGVYVWGYQVPSADVPATTPIN